MLKSTAMPGAVSILLFALLMLAAIRIFDQGITQTHMGAEAEQTRQALDGFVRLVESDWRGLSDQAVLDRLKKIEDPGALVEVQENALLGFHSVYFCFDHGRLHRVTTRPTDCEEQ